MIDLSFRSLMRTFPAYLKKRIINTKGIFYHESTQKSSTLKGSRSANENNVSFSLKTDEIEEQVGKQILPNYHTRLAYQKAFASRKAKSFIYLKYGLIFSLIMGIGTIIFIEIFFSNYFSLRTDDIYKYIPLEKFY